MAGTSLEQAMSTSLPLKLDWVEQVDMGSAVEVRVIAEVAWEVDCLGQNRLAMGLVRVRLERDC